MKEMVKELKYFTKIDAKTWYVQKEKDSSMESFFVTLIPGGLCMSGDYDGCIVMPYTKGNLQTINWMAGATSLSYFTEKVSLGNQNHQIKEYDEEKAREEIASDICMRFDLDDTMKEWFKETLAGWDYDPEELRENLAICEDCHPDSYPEEKFEKIDSIMDQAQYSSLENEHEYYQTIQDLEHNCDLYDLWELDPREYTQQIRWQHQCLLWWARNVVDRFMEDYFEVISSTTND